MGEESARLDAEEVVEEMVVDSPESEQREAPPRLRLEGLPRLGAELLVVFLGVSLAFLLDGYRETRAAAEKRELLMALLIEDLEEGVSSIEIGSEAFERTWGQTFLDPYEQGEQPSLLPIPLFQVSGGSWKAWLGAGAMEVPQAPSTRAPHAPRCQPGS